MTLQAQGSCTRCGASIYVEATDLAKSVVPKPKYSCVCPRPADSTQENLPPNGKVLLS